MRSSQSEFWEFWNLADQAHEIKRSIRTRANTVAPMLTGLLVVALLVVAISQDPTPIAGGGSTGSPGSDDVTFPTSTPVPELPEPDQEVEVASTTGSTGSDAATEGAPTDNASAGAEAPADAVMAHVARPATHATSDAVGEPISVVATGQSGACATPDGYAVGTACPEAPPEEAAKPVPPDVPGVEVVPPPAVPTTVAMWCVLDPASLTGTGCQPGTSQVLQLVDVATVDPLTIAVWCVPQVTTAGVAACGANDTHLLEIVSPTAAIQAAAAASTGSATVAATTSAVPVRPASDTALLQTGAPASTTAAAAPETTLLQSGTSDGAGSATDVADSATQGDPARWSSPDDGGPPMHDHSHGGCEHTQDETAEHGGCDHTQDETAEHDGCNHTDDDTAEHGACDHTHDDTAEHGSCDRTWEPHHDGGDT